MDTLILFCLPLKKAFVSFPVKFMGSDGSACV
jgi:hypothetical protein